MMKHYSENGYKTEAGLTNDLPLAALGTLVEQGRLGELILACEEAHRQTLVQIANQIAGRGVRAVLLAGPSSSGKTTCADRLTLQLRALGLAPVPVSLDDYYIDRDKVKPGPDGKLDLEHIDTIDTALFRQHLAALLAGETVLLPRFDFTTGRRRAGQQALNLGGRSVLIIEGIHGLNPALLPEGIHREEVFRLYICPEYSLRLGDGERLDGRDLRLLRRIIRDHRSRGTAMEKTLTMWASVGRGEQRWIMPYRESADAFFNSALSYEPVFLKGRLAPLLESGAAAVQEDEVFRQVLERLDGVPEVFDHEALPKDSILREFIGS